MPIHDDAPQSSPRAVEGQYVPPSHRRKVFHCPFCGVLTQQRWTTLSFANSASSHIDQVTCDNCHEDGYWRTWISMRSRERGSQMLYPIESAGVPRPHRDLPAEMRDDYNEARSIVDRSPRGATALLRLVTQKLLGHLGQSGKNINADIAALVAAGLPLALQQALDTLRVVGNEAVHPGTLDLKDDRETAVRLFEVVNFIVTEMITRPAELAALYEIVPEDKRKQIDARDGRG